MQSYNGQPVRAELLNTISRSTCEAAPMNPARLLRVTELESAEFVDFASLHFVVLRSLSSLTIETERRSKSRDTRCPEKRRKRQVKTRQIANN